MGRRDEASEDAEVDDVVDDEVESMELSQEDAAFVLGKRGHTKNKIARVSGCEVELLQDSLILEFRGPDSQRRKAMCYARCVMAQRHGAVKVQEVDVANDCTILEMPQDAIGVVTGKSGGSLRALEDEHNVLLCFAEVEGVSEKEGVGKLLIFGERRERRSAQLAIMSTVESKVSEYYLKIWQKKGTTFDDESDLVGDWGTSTKELGSGKEIAYAIGKGGSTRKKIAAASGCIVSYIGDIAFLSGTRQQRNYAKEYLGWMLDQLDESKSTVDVRGRSDCTVVKVPHECVGYITGSHRDGLCRLEESHGVLMFFTDRDSQDDKDATELVIAGSQRGRHGAEYEVMALVERKHQGFFGDSLREQTSGRDSFGTDIVRLEEQDIAYLLGQKGATRKKLAVASNAIFQFVGRYAMIAGIKDERQRCRDYIGWLMDQKEKKEIVVNVDGREDVTEVSVPRGVASHELRDIEQETGTFCFMADEKVFVFGHDAGAPYLDTGRYAAERKVNRLHNSEQDKSWRGGKSKGGKGAKGKRDETNWWSSGKAWEKDWEQSDSRGGNSWRKDRSRSPIRKSQKQDSWNDSQQPKKAGGPLRRLSWEARRKPLR
eukprot:TRINITY_DN91086_c0_g1_i1.p1 TRINITY_DN91086_c0_g1~~TRINITY_DN91086_c0_g1_i1.p1  ORF type:complete len:601 (+),score=117.06 TRINITY_DN91086_c0_g1_i1:74-1876(+)